MLAVEKKNTTSLIVRLNVGKLLSYRMTSVHTIVPYVVAIGVQTMVLSGL